MQSSYFYFLLSMFTVVVAGGCKKKIDLSYDNRPVTGNIISSNTRLVSLAGARELQIGAVRLTSFMPPNQDGGYGTDGTMRITKYFPKTGQLGSTYDIPTEFIGADGFIHDLQVSSLAARDLAPLPRHFTLEDHGRTPFDYYHVRYSSVPGGSSDSLFAIPREVSPSSDPTKFKIRLVNFGLNNDPYDRKGAFTLAWADGTPVDMKSSNIGSGGYSPYVEIPYGSYQFKVLTADGREVPIKANGAASLGVLNPYTGTLMGYGPGTPGPGRFNDNWVTYAPIRTYQPGGVYTIAVASMTGWGYANPGSSGEVIPQAVNSFQLITDVKEPVNYTYARVQAVNTIPGSLLSWKVDQSGLGNTVYSEHTGYGVFITGAYHISAADQNGVLVADSSVKLQAGDNITAWAYTKKDGKAGISISTNNLSGMYSLPAGDNDGSYGVVSDPYPCWIRFMNFCPELPEASFTVNNGVLMSATGSQHVLYGVQKTTDVYVRAQVNFSTDILAYLSEPGVLPGYWISAIDPLKSKAFIADSSLYKTPQKPDSEPGIYTVALVGGLGSGAVEKAKMIIIKHNR